MSRPSLLRRAAAATLGTSRTRTRAPALTAAVELSLARRAAAAVIGIRSYQPVGRPAAAGQASNSPAAARVWEIVRSNDLTRPSTGRAQAPQPEKDTATVHRPPDHNGPSRQSLPNRAAVIFDPASLVVIGGSGTHTHQSRRRPQHTLALAAVATAIAIVFTVFGYQLRPLVQPSRSVGSAPVESGDVPEAYLGSWTATLANAGSENTRSLVIKQGSIGDDILILVADGPTGEDTYHCVFTAALTAAPSNGTRLELGPSTLTSGTPAASCSPGTASTLTLKSDGTLHRSLSRGQTVTYTRTP
ncbi:hypothetical protein [Streptomyces fructofermentans]|uniref:Serine/threonine protein kinase n=1 Tax=Streptomyces fructofermentans TaxID=152141 RepID=A0A918U5B0_9ACTN|nr:hypothetical protein [Streptomyces fructofermentans]GGX94074.1 hypothetical protein GCM10010515_71230 [Streptomyces fructofermentans]